MDLNYSLEQNQSQRLMITPEMKQALRILQYSSQELQAHIEQELETNPLLEIHEEGQRSEEEDFSTAEAPADWKEYFEDLRYDTARENGNIYVDEDRDYSYENMVSQEVTLHEHLLQQVEMMDISGTDKKIAAFIVESLDDNGYSTLSKYEIASILNIDRNKISEVFAMIQSMDPPGVGARSLRECLLIQLRQMDRLTPTLKQVVLEHLPDLARNHYAAIAKSLKLSIHEVQELCDFIKTLEPKPGRKYAGSRSIGYIVPDVEVEKIDGKYQIQVRDTAAPRLRINKVYQDILNSLKPDDGAAAYINEKLNMAFKIIKAIEQRRATLLKVADSIVNRQIEFLDHGILYLKPLTLKMVGEDAEVHESTVSRAVNGKYMQTPRGIFEMKYFFSSGVQNAEGEGVSSQSIKRMIEEIVHSEDPAKPYSDQRISLMLQEQGIEISRRTVAKYREELGISSSSKRKRYS